MMKARSRAGVDPPAGRWGLGRSNCSAMMRSLLWVYFGSRVPSGALGGAIPAGEGGWGRRPAAVDADPDLDQFTPWSVDVNGYCGSGY
jgi:hypothetical protein